MVLARMTSQRLPGKALRDLAGLPLVCRVVQRAGRVSRFSSNPVVVTSSHRSDDVLADWCATHDLEVFRGDLHNVAKRVNDAAHTMGADSVVRISGDSPFIDPHIIDHALKVFANEDADLVTNIQRRTFPVGQSVEVFTTQALTDTLNLGISQYEAEHVTSAFYRPASKLRVLNFTPDDLPNSAHHWVRLSNVSLAVDTEDDLRIAQSICTRLGEEWYTHSWLEIGKLAQQFR